MLWMLEKMFSFFEQQSMGYITGATRSETSGRSWIMEGGDSVQYEASDPREVLTFAMPEHCLGAGLAQVRLVLVLLGHHPSAKRRCDKRIHSENVS